MGQLRGFVRVTRLGFRRPPSVLTKITAEHERIVDALERRDVEAAVAALAEHLHRSDYSIASQAPTDGGAGSAMSDAPAPALTLRQANVLDRSGSFEGPLDVQVVDGRASPP